MNSLYWRRDFPWFQQVKTFWLFKRWIENNFDSKKTSGFKPNIKAYIQVKGQSLTLLIELMKLSNLLVSSVDCQNSSVIRWPICMYFYCSFPALDRLFMHSPYVYIETRIIQMTTFSYLLYKASVPLKRIPFAINIMLDGWIPLLTACVNAINLQGLTLSSNRTTLA